MLAISDAVKEAWLNPARQLSIRVKVDKTMYGSEDVSSLSFDSGSISGEVYQIGSTYMNSVTLSFPSIIETIKEDLEVIPELGILVDGEYHFSKLGHFYITEFNRDRNANITTITANDKMIYLEGTYDSKLTYPKPYREVALEIANLAGVEVNQASFASLGIGAIKKPEGYTYRQAIGLIAQFEGGFASFNRDGELEIRRLQPTEFGVTPESYLLKGFTKNENSYKIGGITVRIGEEETDILKVGNDTGSQVELENKAMTQDLLNQVWNLVKDINYFPFELKWRGCPALEAGDWIYVTDRNGNRYSVPNLSYSMNFNGGLSAESKATTNSVSQSATKYRGSLNQKVQWLESILGSNDWNHNYYDEKPDNPKVGDLWFKKNGKDIEIWQYVEIDGVRDWELKISSAPNQDLLDMIEDLVEATANAQAAADDAKAAGEAAGQLANEAKTESADAIGKVNDVIQDVSVIDQIAKASEQASKLAVEQSSNAVTDAQKAKVDASGALSKAETAISNASEALNQSALAKMQSEEAIQKYQEMGMYQAWSWSADGADRFTKVYPKENLLLGSLDFSEKAFNIHGATGVVVKEDGGSVLTITTQNDYSTDLAYIPVREGDVITFSFDAKTTDPTVWGINLFLLQRYDAIRNRTAWVWKTGKYSQEWQRFSFKETVGAGVSFVGFGPRSYSNILSYRKVKIEKSQAETTYTTAPQDDFDNAYPTYTGFCKEPSDDPKDYTWIKEPNKIDQSTTIEVNRLSDELSTKVSQTTHDQLNATVVNQGTLITQNAGKIALKAEKSTVDTLQRTVEDNAASILVNSNAIQLKADQTKVDSLNDTVLSHSSALDLQADKISGLVTKTDGQATKIGALELQAGQFNLSLSNLDSELSDTVTALTAVKATADGLVTTVATKANQSQVTQLANQITSVVSTVDGHTSQITQMGQDINLRVTQKQVNESILANDQIKDTRNDNQPPSWYYTNYPMRIAKEFKQAATIELPSSAGDFSYLETEIQWKNASGGSIKQTAKANDGTYQRQSLYNDTWTGWTKIADSSNVVSQINVSTEGILIAGEKVWISGLTKIDNAVIGTAHIKDLAVTNAKIANLAVNTAKIGDAAIVTAKIGDLAVTNAKIANLAINDAKIQNASISSAKIISLDANKISAGTVSGLIITSTSSTGRFLVEGQNAVFQNTSTNRKTEINENGVNIYNANGTLRAQFNQNVVNTGIVGTNTYNVYLGTGGVDGTEGEAEGGEVRVVRYDSTPGTGAVTDYTYRPIRAEGFVGNYLNANTPFSTVSHLYLRPRYGTGEVRVTGSGSITTYQDLRARGLYADTLDTNKATAGTNIYIRPASDGEVRTTAYNSITNYVPIRTDVVWSVGVSARDTGSNYYVGADGELRVTARSLGNNGSPIYRNVRAATFYGGAIDSTATNMYVRPASGGEVCATATGTTGTYVPVRASSFPTSSMEEYKQDIVKHTDSALQVINAATIYDYRLRSEVALGRDKVRTGLVIGKNYNTPDCVIDGDGVEQYMMNSLSWKAIQELSAQIKELENQIRVLQLQVA